ncbi:MAG: ABC transporter substrate-binding protein [Bacteroidales bacterium]|nr:ABC transporter substrate-binding protein [Bacteroidales bacterium]MBQ5438235.1 ABC transporter substrate-binding protein [Bacteroidales bacterium]
MKRWLSLLLPACVLLLAVSCRGGASKAGVSPVAGRAGAVAPTYAEGFRVSYTDAGCLVDIQDPQREESQSFHYLLVPAGSKPAQVPEGYTALEVPVSRVVCMTSLQLSNFICLDELDRVVGITSTRHLFNPEMKERLADGRTAKIGIEGNFDNEVILGLDPDLILISPFKRGGYEALKGVDIPLIPHLGYKETTPLGQAEWIKFIGLLTGEEEKANAVFAGIEERYNALKALTADVAERPVVLSGELHGGNWYVGGGRSFLAQIFRDAGGAYFLPDDENSGGLNLDFETVYSQTANARYWRIVNSYNGTFSYDALKAEDARYTDLNAFREKGVVYCNMREKPFYENMPVQPDVVLADLIHIFHPELLPADYQPVFYELLP